MADIAVAKAGGVAPNVLPAVAGDGPLVPSKPGQIQTVAGPVKEYSPPTPTHTGTYCKSYAARMDSKKKWVRASCDPKWGEYKDIMHNLDGVICACGGMKIANIPASTAHPDTAQTVLVRAQATKSRIRSYAYKISTNVEPKRPQPLKGLAWDVELTDQAATVSDTEVEPQKMRSVFIGFNRIFEYADNTGTGLSDTDTKHLDSETGRVWPGRPCDEGKMFNAKQKGQNCVLQDFFLDNFKLPIVRVENTITTVKFVSDIQGTSPWCTKESPECAKPPAKKPTVTFHIGADSASFAHNKMNVTIENFPYKQSNSYLALRSSVYAESVRSSISSKDEVSKSTSTDNVNCNKVPPPKGCPTMDLDDHQVDLNWAKSITDTKTGVTYKVVTTEPARAKSGTVGTDGKRLILKNTYFSFKHGMSKKLLWDPEVNTKPSKLPRDLKKSAASLSTLPHATMLLASTLLALWWGRH